MSSLAEIMRGAKQRSQVGALAVRPEDPCTRVQRLADERIAQVQKIADECIAERDKLRERIKTLQNEERKEALRLKRKCNKELKATQAELAECREQLEAAKAQLGERVLRTPSPPPPSFEELTEAITPEPSLISSASPTPSAGLSTPVLLERALESPVPGDQPPTAVDDAQWRQVLTEALFSEAVLASDDDKRQIDISGIPLQEVQMALTAPQRPWAQLVEVLSKYSENYLTHKSIRTWARRIGRLLRDKCSSANTATECSRSKQLECVWEKQYCSPKLLSSPVVLFLRMTKAHTALRKAGDKEAVQVALRKVQPLLRLKKLKTMYPRLYRRMQDERNRQVAQYRWSAEERAELRLPRPKVVEEEPLHTLESFQESPEEKQEARELASMIPSEQAMQEAIREAERYAAVPPEAPEAPSEPSEPEAPIPPKAPKPRKYKPGKHCAEHSTRADCGRCKWVNKTSTCRAAHNDLRCPSIQTADECRADPACQWKNDKCKSRSLPSPCAGLPAEQCECTWDDATQKCSLLSRSG